jgi:hypothetical protein
MLEDSEERKGFDHIVQWEKVASPSLLHNVGGFEANLQLGYFRQTKL